jgi:uncharacterized SAM-binding protein YcdF (DUF218 family)
MIWILFFFLLGMVLYRRKVSRKLLIAALCMFFIFTNSFITDEMIRITEAPMITLEDSTTYDAGIVLGGGMVTIDRPMDRLIFQDNTDRVLQAVELYKKGRIQRILLSSGSGSMIFSDIYEGALLRRFLIDTGIPDSVILVDSTSRNTHENAINSVQLLNDSLPNGKYLLITSAMHMYRAQACFSKLGCETTAFPVSKKTGDRRWDLGFLLVPEVENLRQWEKLLHEWVGILMYKMNGYI